MLSDEVIFEVLKNQNFWFKDLDLSEFILRKQYFNFDFIESDSILVITGARRTGKTVLLKQFMDLVIKKFSKEQVLYVNLEDYHFFNNYSLNLLEKIISVYEENINPNKKAFVFFDEIQNVPGFEKFIRTKQDEKKIKFIITGSNSKLLSKELGSLLTGRMLSIEVFPFSFKEFLELKQLLPKKIEKNYLNQKILLNELNKYIEFGSIPEFFNEKNHELRLKEYFENIIYKDIIQRFNIRNSKAIKELGIILANNSGKLFSINQLTKLFKISINTLQEYLSDLELTYLFFYLEKYSFSIKEKMNSQSKVYCIDTGLINRITTKFSKDEGRLLENIVFIELKRQGKEVYYFKEKNECDFIIKENTRIIEVIQVTKTIQNEKTKKREIQGLLEAMEKNNLKKGLIITKNEFNEMKIKEKKISIIPLWYWLLKQK